MTEEERLKQFLLEIHMHQGRVCENYELCKHAACRSNHQTWELADAALQGMTLEQFRAEKARVDACAQAGIEDALTIRCFKCGAYAVIKNPGPGVYPQCRCGALDVVVITTERNPEGFINNCALYYEGSAQNCQMCGGGPCPEEHKLRGKVVFRPTNEWATPPDPEAPRDHLVRAQTRSGGFVQKIVHGTPKEVVDQMVDELLGRKK